MERNLTSYFFLEKATHEERVCLLLTQIDLSLKVEPNHPINLKRYLDLSIITLPEFNRYILE